jgi:hypothetical protein
VNTFLLITLSAEPPFTYRQPLMALVKEAAPVWGTLDVDAFSDEHLVAHAARMVREADKLVVVFQSLQPEAPLGACQAVLEALLQRKAPALVLLQGGHRRLQAICQARPHLSWQRADTAAALQAALRQFLSQR